MNRIFHIPIYKKMKKRFSVIIVLAIFIFASCKSSNKDDFKQVVWSIFPDLNEENISFIVIIPNQGCGGCITTAEFFYDRYKDKKELKFIFTNIISKKMLLQKNEINENNTYLDFDNNVLRAYPKDKRI